jgi:hypothetical protein
LCFVPVAAAAAAAVAALPTFLVQALPACCA